VGLKGLQNLIFKICRGRRRGAKERIGPFYCYGISLGAPRRNAPSIQALGLGGSARRFCAKEQSGPQPHGVILFSEIPLFRKHHARHGQVSFWPFATRVLWEQQRHGGQQHYETYTHKSTMVSLGVKLMRIKGRPVRRGHPSLAFFHWAKMLLVVTLHPLA
jgi:hypothetical protein